MELEALIADRFARWGKLLHEENASPILVVGVTEDDFILCTLEGMTDQRIQDVLASCIGMIEEGRRADV